MTTRPPCPGIDERADRVLHQFQVREHVGLERAAHEINRNLRHRPAFAESGVADERVEVPGHRSLDVTEVEHVELVDLDSVRKPELGDFTAQVAHLRPDLRRREDLVAGLGKPDCRTPAKARAGACDQDPLHVVSIPAATRATSPS